MYDIGQFPHINPFEVTIRARCLNLEIRDYSYSVLFKRILICFAYFLLTALFVVRGVLIFLLMYSGAILMILQQAPGPT